MNTSDPKYFSFARSPQGAPMVCYNARAPFGSGLMSIDYFLESLPGFCLLFGIVLALSRICLFFSTLAHVPRFVANLFAGFLIGPSVLGRWHLFQKNVFIYNNMMPLETIANMALVYYMFFIGLRTEFKPLKSCHDTKAQVVAIAGIIFTLPVGYGLYHFLLTNMGRKALPEGTFNHRVGGLTWAMALSCSESSEIADILSDLKLLLTDNGQLALTSSVITDLVSWFFLVVSITNVYNDTPWSILALILFLVVCCFLVYPFAKWLFDKIGSGDRDVIESQVVFLLHVVLLFGLISDGLGAYSITGAFLLGAAFPKGVLRNAVLEKVYEFVNGFMMPLFFAGIGERVKIQEVALDISWITLLIVFVLAFSAKLLCVFMISYCVYHMPLREALSLALLMNTKGMMPVLMLTTVRNRQVISTQTFAVMMVACWLMTAPVGPVLASWRKTRTGSKKHGQRKSIQGTHPDSSLRVLACVHTKVDANAIINLLIASSPSVRSPIQVVAVELIKKTSDIAASSLIIRPSLKPTKPKTDSDIPNTKEDTLDSFDDLNQAIFTEKMRVISDYDTMHKDIFNLADQRGVTLIFTTFHKKPTYDGLGAGTATARAVNIISRDQAHRDETKVVLENLVEKTPCCLAIFLDRGLSQRLVKQQQYVMLYVAGADDREALSYAWRMSKNGEAQLTVVRLVWDNIEDEFDEMDDEYLNGFVHQTRGMPWVRYLEKVVRDEKETVTLLNNIGNKGFDLFIIGRGHGRKMALAQTESPVLDEPALGPLGDTLADLHSAGQTSILILQSQYHHDDVFGNYVGSTSSRLGGSYRNILHPTHLANEFASGQLAWHTSKKFFSPDY